MSRLRRDLALVAVLTVSHSALPLAHATDSSWLARMEASFGDPRR